MAFEVRPDGTIVARTPEEAVALSRRITMRSAAIDPPGPRREWPGLRRTDVGWHRFMASRIAARTAKKK